MNNNDFGESLKAKLDELKDKTLSHLLQEDGAYQNATVQHGIAESDYMHLNLTPEQKDVVDRLLTCTDEGNMEYSTLSYLAGLFDSQKIYKLFAPATTSTSDCGFIKEFYQGSNIPVEKPFESASTLKVWKTYNELTESFISSLSPSQVIAFQALQVKQAEGQSMSFEDSFIFGFQTGARLLIDIFR